MAFNSFLRFWIYSLVFILEYQNSVQSDVIFILYKQKCYTLVLICHIKTLTRHILFIALSSQTFCILCNHCYYLPMSYYLFHNIFYQKKKLRSRQKKLKVYNLSSLSEFLPEMKVRQQLTTAEFKLNCKSRQKLMWVFQISHYKFLLRFFYFSHIVT